MKKPYVAAIIVAAGQGTRMKAGVNKQYLHLHGKPILAYTLEAFEECSAIDEIFVVVGENEREKCFQEVIKPYGYKKIEKVVLGGATRQESVYNGLKEITTDIDIVITHDGARPLIHKQTLISSIQETLIHKGTIVGVPAKDTIKILNSKGFVDNTPKRDLLWSVQTPQCFSHEILMQAHKRALKDGFIGTDDAMLVERMGYPIKMIKGTYDNIKITTPEDLIIAEAILNIRGR